VCVCVCVREREREHVHASVCERVSVCVCVCVSIIVTIRTGLVSSVDLQSFVIILEVVYDLNPVPIGHVCNFVPLEL